MRKILKDVLWPGVWNYPDGRTLRVTAADIDQAAKNGNQMLKDGLAVKWIWEHQQGAAPMLMSDWVRTIKSSADWAKSVVADTVSFEKRTDKDGKPVLVAAFDASKLTPNEIEQIRRVGKVSARIDKNFRELSETGKRYPGLSIGHIAITPKPVHSQQGPFLMGRPPKGRLFGSDDFFYMGAGNMADEKDGDKAASAGGEFSGVLECIKKLGAKYGFMIPDSAVDWATLCVALDTVAGDEGDGDNDADDMYSLDDEAGDDAGTTTDGAAPAAGPMMMSQLAMQQKRPNLVKLAHAEAAAEIKLAMKEGRLPRVEASKMMQELKTFQMSFVGGKLLDTGLVAGIKTIRRFIPKNTFISKKSFEMSTLEHPEKFTPKTVDEDDEFTEKLVKEIEARNPQTAK